MAKDRANYHHFPALLHPARFPVERPVLADGVSFCELPRSKKPARLAAVGASEIWVASSGESGAVWWPEDLLSS
jgi:hypothetical protein